MQTPQPQQQIEVDLDTYLGTLREQRNQALDMVAQQAGLIARLQKQIAELTPSKEPPAITVKPGGPTLVPPAAE